MPGSVNHNLGDKFSYRIVIVTLDSHNARPCERALNNMLPDFAGLKIDIFAAAEWDEDPESFEIVKKAIRDADIIIINLLFLEHHVKKLLPEIQLRRNSCDAIVGMISDAELVKQTKMGALDMLSPQSNTMALLKNLGGHLSLQLKLVKRRCGCYGGFLSFSSSFQVSRRTFALGF